MVFIKKILKKLDSLKFRDLKFNDEFDSSITIYYNKEWNELKKLFEKYGSDKGGIFELGQPYKWASHSYADYYYRLFSNNKNSIKKVLECGIGTNNPKLISTMGAGGMPGASLKAWRDFFPNAQIYGVDIDRSILFQDERIQTFYMDQLDKNSIASFWKKVSVDSFDFIIDDGLHTFEAGSCFFENSYNYLCDNGIYVIEDVCISDFLKYKNFFLNFRCHVDYICLKRPNQKLGDNNLILIRKF